MIREEMDFIGSMNMCDEISNEAYKKIMAHCEEQEPCEDCISREAVLDKWKNTTLRGRTEFDQVIMMMPPVTPQPKTGRWIFDYMDIGETLDKHYYCSECKSMGVDYWDFCPNCGAKMEVSE